MGKNKIINHVILVACDANGNLVEKLEVPCERYYSDGVSVVDSNTYRKDKEIRLLSGRIYDSKGDLQQSFENHYTSAGAYHKGRITYADGTIVED